MRPVQLEQMGALLRAADAAALTAPLPLTHREREIVTLAAGGLSNREIAQRLVLSIRTVENHLYRAGTKLGTSDRAALAALLHATAQMSTRPSRQLSNRLLIPPHRALATVSVTTSTVGSFHE